MANDISNRTRLLQAIPKDRQLALAKALEKHGIEDDDPLVLLCIEILEGEARHIQNEFKRHHPILKEIYREETWHKILTSRLMTFVVGPLIATGLIMTFVMFFRKTEVEAFRTVVEDPKSVSVALIDGAKALRETSQNMKAMAILLNLPDAVIGSSKNGKVVIQFPTDQASVTQGPKKISLELSRDPKLFEIDLTIQPPVEEEE